MAGEPQLCAWEDDGADPPRSCITAREGPSGDLRASAAVPRAERSNLVASDDGGWGKVDVIDLCFCRAFDTVPHHVLLSHLERLGFEG